MKVLTVYAHHDPQSFCHSVLERFVAGLGEAGHTSEVVALYAIGFDPVLRDPRRAQLDRRERPARDPGVDGSAAAGAGWLPLVRWQRWLAPAGHPPGKSRAGDRGD